MIRLKIHTTHEVTPKVSCFIAGLLGPMFLAAGAALLINRPLFADMLAVAGREPLLIMLAGFLSLLAGCAIVQVHNLWQGWPVLVSLVGWLAIITGVARILFPLQMAAFAALWASIPGVVPVMAVVLLVLGAYLSWRAYSHR
ncbi:MAG TPA: hypothetical protein VGM16_06005 [Gammaproteobacteria bacterium]|jgi:hypothetical protein